MGPGSHDFLKSTPDKDELKTVSYKGALVSAATLETSLVGAFIVDLSRTAEAKFQKLLNIFMGVLVEEFIGSVSSLGSKDESSKLTVLYDTSVLMRLLGCSGKLLRTATEELTRYLQDLGMEIKYLGGNEEEVHGILDAILHKKDSGLDIEGETADAVSRGEVTISDLRMLQNNVAEKLAAMTIFRLDNVPTPSTLAAYQINEAGFANFLFEEARKAGRNYNVQNRTNDASYLGTVMRLRRGKRVRDLLAAGYIFIASNKFLVNCARRYLLRERQLHQQDCPSMLHVGQIATIAWLMKDHKLSPERAGRDLLSNCYAAFRPDAEWFRYFREKIEQEVGSLDEFSERPGAGITLQAARRIALDETLGHSALVRQLSGAELLARASEAADQERAATVAEAREEGLQVGEMLVRTRTEKRAKEFAQRVFRGLKVLSIFAFIACSAVGIFFDRGTTWLVAQMTVTFFATLSVADLVGFQVASRWLAGLEMMLARKYAEYLQGGSELRRIEQDANRPEGS